MHDARFGRKGGQFAGDAVVKACAHAHEHIGIVDSQVGRVGAVHTHHAKPEGVCGGKGAQPHEGAGDRDLQFAGQSGQGLAGVGHDHAAAGQNDRAFRLGQFFHRAPQLVQVGLVGGVVAAHGNGIGPDKFRPGLHDVLGQVHQHGAGTAGAGQEEGLADGFGQFAHILDQKVVLGAGARDAYDVHFLKGVVADELGGYLPGKYH